MRRLLYPLFAAALTGCYTLQPARTAVEPGNEVALDITDEGRVALTENVGPEVLQLEGRLLSIDNGDYVLGVNVVRFLRGGEQVWRGERVRVPEDHVRTVYERRFSKGRTAVMAAVTAGAVALFIVTRSLLGFGRDNGGPPDNDLPTLTWPPAWITP